MKIDLDQVDSGFYDFSITNTKNEVVAWGCHVTWDKVMQAIKTWRLILLVT